ncbi:MAG: hypothetical protein J1F32_02050 [Erysipelotrichales bacterium]|nr:hypothetical protein [Erysipelotrichales bacterium]
MKKRKYLDKHLEFIQQIIDRMSSNSFAIKGWLIGLITAGFVFASKEFSKYLILASIFLIFVFMFLDAKYLQNERKFRTLYKKIIEDPNMKNFDEFDMNIEHPLIKKDNKTKYFSCLKSHAIWLPYLGILIYNLLLFFIPLLFPCI